MKKHAPPPTKFTPTGTAQGKAGKSASAATVQVPPPTKFASAGTMQGKAGKPVSAATVQVPPPTKFAPLGMVQRTPTAGRNPSRGAAPPATAFGPLAAMQRKSALPLQAATKHSVPPSRSCSCPAGNRAMPSLGGATIQAMDDKIGIRAKSFSNKKLDEAEGALYELSNQWYPDNEIALVYVDIDSLPEQNVQGLSGATVALGGVQNLENKIVTHNHPSGSELSNADIRFACNRNLAEIRAIGKYGVFYLKRPAGKLRWLDSHKSFDLHVLYGGPVGQAQKKMEDKGYKKEKRGSEAYMKAWGLLFALYQFEFIAEKLGSDYGSPAGYEDMRLQELIDADYN